jgi:transposase, IS30 family
MYHQLTEPERYTLSVLHRDGQSLRAIARLLGRSPSTISREVQRNRCHRTDGAYRPSKAQERTNGRRSRSRRNRQFSAHSMRAVEQLLRLQWSPEQIAGYLKRHGLMRISHETIYQHIWRDKRAGGALYKQLRLPAKQRPQILT